MIKSMVAAALVLGIWGAARAQQGAIRVVVNGQQLSFPDQQPVMVHNRVLVPLRGVFESMGARLDWDPADQTVTATRGSVKVMLTIKSADASINGRPVGMDVPAQLMGGRTMVPLRFVSESLGAQVGWDDATSTVTIQARGGAAAPTVSRQLGQPAHWVSFSDFSPAVGGEVAMRRPTIYVLLHHGAAPIDPRRVFVWVNGQDVTNRATITRDFVSFTPAYQLPLGAVDVRVLAYDTQGHSAETSWVFSVIQ